MAGGPSSRSMKQMRMKHSGKMDKVHRVMSEFKSGTLHSGSKHGPRVKSRKQAIAIGMSEQRKKDRGGY